MLRRVAGREGEEANVFSSGRVVRAQWGRRGRRRWAYDDAGFLLSRHRDEAVGRRANPSCLYHLLLPAASQAKPGPTVAESSRAQDSLQETAHTIQQPEQGKLQFLLETITTFACYTQHSCCTVLRTWLTL